MKPTEEKTRSNPSDLPVYLFKQGNNCEAYRYFGAHIEQRAGETGVVFRVWAPHATAISVVGDFNSWKPGSHPMRKVDNDSVWELFIPGMKEYDVYKYCVTTRAGDLVYKADPYAFHAETRPSNGSKVYDLNGFVWHDEAWQNAQNWANRAIVQGDAKEAGSWTKTANVYFGQCQSCATALGLSVSARCRLVMPEPPKDEADEDPLSRMLRERAERRKA